MLFQALSVYAAVTKQQTHKKSLFKKIPALKPQDNLAEYFSDKEELRKHREKLELESKNLP